MPRAPLLDLKDCGGNFGRIKIESRLSRVHSVICVMERGNMQEIGRSVKCMCSELFLCNPESVGTDIGIRTGALWSPYGGFRPTILRLLLPAREHNSFSSNAS